MLLSYNYMLNAVLNFIVMHKMRCFDMRLTYVFPIN